MAKVTTIEVKVDATKSVEKSLKKFKRLCEAFGITREFRKRKEYKKPSIRLKEKEKAAQKRRNKAVNKAIRSSSKI